MADKTEREMYIHINVFVLSCDFVRPCIVRQFPTCNFG